MAKFRVVVEVEITSRYGDSEPIQQEAEKVLEVCAAYLIEDRIGGPVVFQGLKILHEAVDTGRRTGQDTEITGWHERRGFGEDGPR